MKSNLTKLMFRIRVITFNDFTAKKSQGYRKDVTKKDKASKKTEG